MITSFADLLSDTMGSLSKQDGRNAVHFLVWHVIPLGTGAGISIALAWLAFKVVDYTVLRFGAAMLWVLLSSGFFGIAILTIQDAILTRLGYPTFLEGWDVRDADPPEDPRQPVQF